MVAITGSRYPDLIIGLIIVLFVLNGARKILQLKMNKIYRLKVNLSSGLPTFFILK